jgi:hypothetical protein
MKNNIMILSLSVALLSTSAFAMEDAASADAASAVAASAVARPAAPGGPQMADVQAPLSAEKMALMKELVKTRVYTDAYMDSQLISGGYPYGGMDGKQIQNDEDCDAARREKSAHKDGYVGKLMELNSQANSFEIPVGTTDQLVAFCEEKFGIKNGWSFKLTNPLASAKIDKSGRPHSELTTTYGSNLGALWRNISEADFERVYQEALASLGLQG